MHLICVVEAKNMALHQWLSQPLATDPRATYQAKAAAFAKLDGTGHAHMQACWANLAETAWSCT